MCEIGIVVSHPPVGWSEHGVTMTIEARESVAVEEYDVVFPKEGS